MLWTDYDSDYLAYLPALFSDSVAFSQLAICINQELDDLKAAITAELANGCLLTADSQILRRYQDFLGITGSGDLAECRRQVMARLRERPPINGQRLSIWLDALVGSIRKIEAGVEPYSVVIKYKSQIDLDEAYLLEQLQRILPANLVIELVYEYFEWQAAVGMSWQEVKAYTWDGLKNLTMD